MQERPLSESHKSSSRKLGFVGEEVMRTYTKDDIIQIVEEEDVEFIRLQFTDMLGTLKNIAITASQLPKALEHACTFDDPVWKDLSGWRKRICIYIPIHLRLKYFHGGHSRGKLPGCSVMSISVMGHHLRAIPARF